MPALTVTLSKCNPPLKKGFFMALLVGSLSQRLSYRLFERHGAALLPGGFGYSGV